MTITQKPATAAVVFYPTPDRFTWSPSAFRRKDLASLGFRDGDLRLIRQPWSKIRV